MMSEDDLRRLLPSGTGVHFDFSQRGIISLKPEGKTNAMLNGDPITKDGSIHLLREDTKLLHIGDMLLRAEVFSSHF